MYLKVHQRHSATIWRDMFLLKNTRGLEKWFIETSPHPGRGEHFRSALLISFFFSNPRLFCSSKGPIYSSAEVERDFPPSELFLLMFECVMIFFFYFPFFLRRRFSWKKDKSHLVSLIMATPAWGSGTGISPRAGSRSPTHTSQSWEVSRDDAEEALQLQRVKAMNPILAKTFKKSQQRRVESCSFL